MVFGVDVKYKDTHLFPHLIDRCMNLNYNFTNRKVDMDFVDLLINTETQLDDVYLFEKFSRMCPRPCYLNKQDVGTCRKSPNLKDLEVVNEFTSNPGCYLNDFFQKHCLSYSAMKRKTVNSFKSLFNPDSNIFMYADKWSYLHMPKRVELELSMDNLSYLLFLKMVKNCETKNCKEIQELVSAGALKNLSVKFVAVRVDLTSEDPEQRLNLSFGLTFNVDQFRVNNINQLFDFSIKDVDFDVYYDVLLGFDPSPTFNGSDNEVKNGDKAATLRDRYNKYMEPRLNKYKIKQEPNGSDQSDRFQNKFEFLNMKGLGQHREVTLSATVNTSVFRMLRPLNSRFYLKLTHMLDTGVYIDNDEIQNSFHFVNHESELFKRHPDAMVADEDGTARVTLTLLSTPFVDIEQPEMNSSPVIYHGYVVVDESVLNFKKLAVTYTLTLHTRYMNMNKTITDELERVDNLRLLRSQVSREYAMVMVSQPNLYVLNPYSAFESVALEYPYLRSLLFMRKASFNTFAGSEYSTKVSDRLVVDGAEVKWVPMRFTDCNSCNISLKLCQGYRTGLATSTKVVNTYFCNPIIREMGGDVVESGCYLVFSVPVGDQYEYRFVSNVTFSVIFISCLVSAVMVFKYMDKMGHKIGHKQKSK
ncbi:hypothetical protein MACJ_001073 [Theileria orientalis]|uniref:Uncharacterized protein n=1 Tax=Theileria orientalis TaxID=68886 RepID=A0A976M7Y2_THEOR|nr:hypothetical protein MACJ_001073 [Theileria orientalis]